MTLKELLNSPDKWCKKNLAEDIGKNSVDPTSDDAVKWCLLGAFRKCAESNEIFRKLQEVVDKKYETRSPLISPSISGFNDDPDTTFENVLDVLDEVYSEGENNESA